MGMQGKKQLEQDTTVNAPPGAVYRLFMDNAELANWAPAVDAVAHEHGGDETGLGATRTCAVTMNGKKGTMVERCVEAVPSARLVPGRGRLLRVHHDVHRLRLHRPLHPGGRRADRGADRDVLHTGEPDRRRTQQAGHAPPTPERRRPAPRRAARPTQPEDPTLHADTHMRR